MEKWFDCYKDRYGIYVDDLIVSEEYRDRGVATRLIEECMSFAKKRGIHLLTCKIWKFNKESKALFVKFGFKEDYSFYSHKR